MIDGQRMDLTKFRYKDFDELNYIVKESNTVGLMTQNVMGIDSAYRQLHGVPSLTLRSSNSFRNSKSINKYLKRCRRR